jgi:hypothetical protein
MLRVRSVTRRSDSGLEFATLTPEVQKLLTAFLEAQGVPPGDREASQGVPWSAHRPE